MAATKEESETSNEVIDDNAIATQGIAMLINIDLKAAEELFKKHKNRSPLLASCHSFIKVLYAFLSSDDRKLDEALTCVKETLKFCESENYTFENFKNRIFKRSSVNKTLEQIERKILAADCQLYIGVLYMMKQELTGFIKGGWNFRKALKNYEKCHAKLREMMTEQREMNGVTTAAECRSENGCLKQDVNPTEKSKENSSGNEMASGSSTVHEKQQLKRLHGSASFGYGAFNLALSYIPPNYLRIASITGFVGDRRTGLRSLHVAYESDDMKSSLAMMMLLCYHCVMSPFFCQDEENSEVMMQEAEKMLAENEQLYSESALFLFFQARTLRCQKRLSEAISALVHAINHTQLRDVALLCWQDLAWCRILQMEWVGALQCVFRLKTGQKWIYGMWGYLAALLHGLTSKVELGWCRKYLVQIIMTSNDSRNSMDNYVYRKANHLAKVDLTSEICFISLLELLYLCNSFPDCSDATLESFMLECNRITDKTLEGSKRLVLGGIYKSLNEPVISLENFQRAILLTEQDETNDSHITPFACFESALLYLKFDPNKGRRLLDRSACYTGYDLEDRLRMRIHSKKTELFSRSSEDHHHQPPPAAVAVVDH